MKFLIAALLFTSAFAHAETRVAGSCQTKILKAAEKAAVIDGTVFDAIDIQQDDDENPFLFYLAYSDGSDQDTCYYNINVIIKQKKKSGGIVTECTIESAEDDEQPNCG